MNDAPASAPISVLIADDDALMRAGLRLILEADPALMVSGEAGDGAQAVHLAARLRPDVALVDIRMPRMDGLAATRAIVALPGRPPRVIVLTTFDLDEYVFGALRAGASGFLLKRSPPEQLVEAVKTVAAGDSVLSPAVTRRVIEEFTAQTPLTVHRPPALDAFTPREREVFSLVAHGLSNADIARRLYVSDATVKTHVARVLAKLGLHDRVQVVVLAYETGQVKPGES
jgi:DNA-binding NarL/FixJ family response regulator